jgi:hypothetical protein
VGLISRVVVVDPEITFGLERERHSAVLGKGVVHLCVRACVHACESWGHVGSLPCRVFLWSGETYMIEETDSGRDIDDLLGC